MPPKNLRYLIELLTQGERSGRSHGPVSEEIVKPSVEFLVARVAGGAFGYGIAYLLFGSTTRRIEKSQMPYMPKKNADS